MNTFKSSPYYSLTTQICWCETSDTRLIVSGWLYRQHVGGEEDTQQTLGVHLHLRMNHQSLREARRQSICSECSRASLSLFYQEKKENKTKKEEKEKQKKKRMLMSFILILFSFVLKRLTRRLTCYLYTYISFHGNETWHSLAGSPLLSRMNTIIKTVCLSLCLV